MRSNLSKEEVRTLAREAGVRVSWWNTNTSAFKIEGTQSQLATFRSLVTEAMGGIAYIVTDDGSYPYWGSRLYRPMDQMTTHA